MRIRFLSILVMLTALFVSQQALAQTYTAIPLIAGRQIYVAGLNNSGSSVGAAGISPRFAYRWTPDGTTHGLGNLGGNFTEAFAINNLGEAVGEGELPGHTSFHAFLWTPADGMHDLGTLGDGNSFAYAINDSTQVVGEVRSTGLDHAFLWTQAGGMQDLGTLGGSFSRALGINALGHVVGISTVADGSAHAFFWTAQDGMTELDLGSTLGSSASAINDSDQVVGWFDHPGDGEQHAFLWDPTTGAHDLGTLSGGVSRASVALAINNSGDVVGYSWILKAGKTKASSFSVIWRHGGAIQKLGPLVVGRVAGSLPRGATGINSSGQIVANGSGAWFLTPQ